MLTLILGDMTSKWTCLKSFLGTLERRDFPQKSLPVDSLNYGCEITTFLLQSEPFPVLILSLVTISLDCACVFKCSMYCILHFVFQNAPCMHVNEYLFDKIISSFTEAILIIQRSDLQPLKSQVVTLIRRIFIYVVFLYSSMPAAICSQRFWMVCGRQLKL